MPPLFACSQASGGAEVRQQSPSADSNRRRPAEKAIPMRPKPYPGCYIVLCAFLVALFGCGLGFYGPGVYLYFLQQQNGWSTSLIASAVTAYNLSGARLLAGVVQFFVRFGP